MSEEFFSRPSRDSGRFRGGGRGRGGFRDDRFRDDGFRDDGRF